MSDRSLAAVDRCLREPRPAIGADCATKSVNFLDSLVDAAVLPSDNV